MTDSVDTLQEEPSDRTQQSLGALSRLSAKPASVRVHNEPAFVLTTWPWKESSVIAECLTRHHGRVVVAVRGAKRPGGQFRGLINPFSPLMIGYFGAQDVKKLTAARWMGGLAPLSGEGLLAGFYLNELVVRLTAREDPHPALFDLYVRTLSTIADSQDAVTVQRALRLFELELLDVCGWGQTAQDMDESAAYWCVDEGRLVPVAPDETLSSHVVCVTARTARAISHRDFSDSTTLKESRDALRAIIRYYVGDKDLLTRRTVAQWQGFV